MGIRLTGFARIVASRNCPGVAQRWIQTVLCAKVDLRPEIRRGNEKMRFSGWLALPTPTEGGVLRCSRGVVHSNVSSPGENKHGWTPRFH